MPLPLPSRAEPRRADVGERQAGEVKVSKETMDAETLGFRTSTILLKCEVAVKPQKAQAMKLLRLSKVRKEIAASPDKAAAVKRF